MRTLAIIGAGGHLGGSIACAALARGADPATLTLGSRSPARLGEDIARSARVVRADYDDPDSLRSALAGVDRALLIPSGAPPASRVAQLNSALGAARAAGVGHVLTTTLIGTAVENPFTVMPYLVYAESALRTSGLRWTILRAAMYADPLGDWLPAIVAMGRIPYPTGPGHAAYAVKDDLAAAAAGALVGEGHEDRVYHLTGPQALSTADLHDIVARVTGAEVVYRPADDADYLAASPGTPASFVTLYHAVREGFADIVTDHIAVLSGRRPESLEEYLRQRWSTRAGEGDR